VIGGRLWSTRVSHVSLAKSERASLCDLLEEVGPDAPTLCEGWMTLDLAAHLVVRERRIDSGPGLLIPAFSGWTDRVRTRAKTQGLERLVEQIRSGPPAWSPMRLADDAVNGMEYFIHHEDIRRARTGWMPRDLPADLDAELWKRVASGAKLAMRRAPVGVVLERPDGTSVKVRSRQPSVAVVGPPAEIALFTSGRLSAAQVELRGDPGAVEQLLSAKLGV
jgi:uncharacterized protein (TIGR03085 family)